MGQNWTVLEELPETHADLLKGLLEAQGIPVFLSQEGAGRAMGITMGILGRVHVLVPEDALDRAQEIIEEYYQGGFEGEELTESESEDDGQKTEEN